MKKLIEELEIASSFEEVIRIKRSKYEKIVSDKQKII